MLFRSSYVVLAETKDGLEQSNQRDISFSIYGSNDAPKNLQLLDYINSIDENLSGVTLGRIQATDSDQDPLTYSVSDPYDYLFINETDQTLRLKPTAHFDFETVTEYSFMLTVTDGFDSIELNKTLLINDINEAPTITPLNPLELDAGNSAKSYVNVFASDPEGAPLSFDIIGPDGIAPTYNQNQLIIFSTNIDYFKFNTVTHEITYYIDRENSQLKSLDLGDVLEREFKFTALADGLLSEEVT